MTRETAAVVSAAALSAAAGVGGLACYLTVTGKLTADTGWGRRVRPLGPFSIDIAAPVGTVFDVIAIPYSGRTPRAMADKLRVLERGTDVLLAEHYSRVHGGRLTTTTVETVIFDRPRWVASGWFAGQCSVWRKSSASASAAAPPPSPTPES